MDPSLELKGAVHTADEMGLGKVSTLRTHFRESICQPRHSSDYPNYLLPCLPTRAYSSSFHGRLPARSARQLGQGIRSFRSRYPCGDILRHEGRTRRNSQDTDGHGRGRPGVLPRQSYVSRGCNGSCCRCCPIEGKGQGQGQKQGWCTRGVEGSWSRSW